MVISPLVKFLMRDNSRFSHLTDMLTAVVALQQCAKASHALDVSGIASQAAQASVVSGNPKA